MKRTCKRTYSVNSLFRNFSKKKKNENEETVNEKTILLKDSYYDFIKRNEILLKQTLILKKKYALLYFQNQNFSTSLLYDSLLIHKKFRSNRNSYDSTILSHYKATLITFLEAFSMISKKDQTLAKTMSKHKNNIELFIKNLDNIIDMVPDSKLKITQKLDKHSIKEQTNKYFQSNTFLIDFVKTSSIKQETVLKQYTGFVIIQQLCTLISHFQDVLGNLKDIIHIHKCHYNKNNNNNLCVYNKEWDIQN